MMAVIVGLIFAGACAVALVVIISSVAPQWHRIARLVSGHVEPAFQPIQTLIIADRRVAVRRWTSASIQARLARLHEAA